MTKEELIERADKIIKRCEERKLGIVTNPFAPMPTLQDFKDNSAKAFRRLRDFVEEYDTICKTIDRYEWYRSMLNEID